jgi:hypothetical protein
MYSGFTFEISIPIWLLLIISIILLFLIPALQSLQKESYPEFLAYRNDNIFGIDLSWDWSPPGFYNDKYSIKDLHLRCPSCKSSLKLNEYSYQLVCCINDNCKWEWQQNSSENGILNYNQLEQKLLNVIDRKIYNKEYLLRPEIINAPA